MDTDQEPQNFHKETHLQPHEQKLKGSLEKMRKFLSQNHEKSFRDFWETKKECLLFFKEKIHPALRKQFWTEYIELSGEAKKLKELLDQQSDYTALQIEKAIQSLNHDFDHLQSMVETLPKVNIPKNCETLFLEKDFYQSTQALLQIYNSFATRIHALRKELIHVDVRMRQKNQFFKLLSKNGNLIFPKRKELIQEISQKFEKDVQIFIQKNFEEKSKHPFYRLKEEIKYLQALAKQFTLNTEIFKSTREKLSQCWDQIRENEKKLKQRRQDSKKEPKTLAKEPKQEKQAPLEEDSSYHREEYTKLAQCLSETFENIQKVSEQSLKDLCLKIQSFMEHASFSKTQNDRLSQFQNHIQDWICEKNEAKQDLFSLDQLRSVLEQKNKRKKKTKTNLEVYRKMLGNSNLDFESNFLLQEILEDEKQHLEKMNASIEEIEDRIFDFES